MKKLFSKYYFIYSFIFVVASLFAMSCAGVGTTSTGKFTKKETASRTAISSVNSNIFSNLEKKLDTIATLSHGTGYAIEETIKKDTNAPPEIHVANQLNERVQSVSGPANIEEINRIRQIVTFLASTNDADIARGTLELQKLDKEIQTIQQQYNELQKQKETEIARYMAIAQAAAAKSDSMASDLSQMNKWFGIGAIWYGIKRLFTSIFWGAIIFGVIFLVLRVLSTTNPIAASIFAVFDVIFSWMVSFFKSISPKAFQLSGFVKKEDLEKYKRVLYKLVDNIQIIKELQKKTNNEKKFTIDELMNELAKSMDTGEKLLINDIKVKLGYK